MRRVLLIALFLGWSTEVSAQEVRHLDYVTVSKLTDAAYSDPAMAQLVFEEAIRWADDAYRELCLFFEPLGTTNCSNPDAVNIPIQVLDDITMFHGLISSGADAVWAPEIGGMYLGTRNLTRVDGEVNLRSTIAHEMVHVILHTVLGIDSQSNLHILEGIGDIAEHFVWDEGPWLQARVQNYLVNSLIGDAGHAADYFETSQRYQGSFFLYFVWKTKGYSNLIIELIELHQEGYDEVEIFRQLGLSAYWQEFSKRVWNFQGVEPILLGGAQVVGSEGVPVMPFAEEFGRVRHEGQPITFEMGRLAWEDALFHVQDNANMRFALSDELLRDGVSVHAYYHRTGLDQWEYHDWTGRAEVLVCQDAFGACEGTDLTEEMGNIFVIVANESIDEPLTGTITSSFAIGGSWRATEVQLSGDRFTPVVGELEISFPTSGTATTASDGWWMTFQPDLFLEPNPTQLDAIITDIFNQDCTFRGNTSLEIVGYEDAHNAGAGGSESILHRPRVRRSGPTDFHSSPSGFHCVSHPTEVLQARYPDLPIVPDVRVEIDAALQRMNNDPMPPGSLMDTFANVMGGAHLFMAPDGEVHMMEFEYRPEETPRRLIMHLVPGTFIRLHLEPVD